MASTQCFVTAFNASGHPLPLQFAAIGLIFVAIRAVMLIFRQSRAVQSLYHGPPGGQTVVAILMIGFASLWTTAVAYDTLREWWSVNFGAAEVVEGTVEQFHPMPFTGHDTDHFVVNGVRFDYFRLQALIWIQSNQ
jgi:hypothetical protein